MNLQGKYQLLKTITVILGAFYIPWGTFTGFCFGDGRYLIAIVSLCLQTSVAVIDGFIWYWLLENVRGSKL